jgi:cleavage stimulation factor subunit 3
MTTDEHETDNLQGIKAARGIFGKARKSPHTTWHTFEASAMMEFHSNKDSAVAIRIFELGFKLFAENVDYVIKYLQFLLSVNDDSSESRTLFMIIPTQRQ